MADKKLKLDINKDKIEVNVDGEMAVVKYTDSKLYGKNRPDGMTYETLQEVNDYNVDYTHAATELVVDEAKKIFKKHKGVKTVTASLPYMPRGSVGVAVHKSKKFRSPKSGEEFHKPQVQTTVKTVSNKANKEWLHSLADDIKKSL